MCTHHSLCAHCSLASSQKGITEIFSTLVEAPKDNAVILKIIIIITFNVATQEAEEKNERKAATA